MKLNWQWVSWFAAFGGRYYVMSASPSALLFLFIFDFNFSKKKSVCSVRRLQESLCLIFMRLWMECYRSVQLGRCGQFDPLSLHLSDPLRALELQPYSLKPLLSRAMAYESLERYRKAYVDYKTVLQIDTGVQAAHDRVHRSADIRNCSYFMWLHFNDICV